MRLKESVVGVARCLRLPRFSFAPPPPLARGVVAAVVGIDYNREDGGQLTEAQEHLISAHLIRAIEASGCGQFDGAERDSTQVLWYFSGSDVRALETILVPALRKEPRCRGGSLRLTSNGVVGPWREIRI